MCRVLITWPGGFVVDMSSQASLLRKQQFWAGQSSLESPREHYAGSCGHFALVSVLLDMLKVSFKRSRGVFRMRGNSRGWVLTCVEVVQIFALFESSKVCCMYHWRNLLSG